MVHDAQPYEEKAKADKARYEKEKAAYEAENPDAAPAKAAPKKKAPAKKAKKASSDDDDEEDDKVDEDDEDDEWSVLPATSPPLTPRGLTFSRAVHADRLAYSLILPSALRCSRNPSTRTTRLIPPSFLSFT